MVSHEPALVSRGCGHDPRLLRRFCCRPRPGRKHLPAGEILIYNAQHVSLTKEWTDAFTAATGIKTTVRNGSDTELGNQIVQEGAASPADVFLTENSPAMALVERSRAVRPG